MTDHPQIRESPLRQALSFSLLNTALSKVGGLLVGVLLARILAPHDFGVFAVALVVMGAVLSFNELGVSLAIVRWRTDPDEILPTVTTISIVSSCLLYAGCWVLAPAFSELMGAPDATGVVRLLSVVVIIDGFTAAASQLVNREFRQGARLSVDVLNLAITTTLTVTLAVNGHGAWSLAWGQLAGNTLSALLLFKLVARWPRPGFDRQIAGKVLRFGFPLAGASLLVFAMLNVDYVVIGLRLDAVALGLYLMAFNLSSWPVNTFSTVVRRVSLAAFSEVQDSRRQREEVLGRLLVLLTAVSLPVCVLLGMLALPMITTLYGPRWAMAASALQFLAVLGFVRILTELAYDFLVAVGRPRLCMWLQLGWFVALLVALPVGAGAAGIEGVAIAQAAVAGVLVLPLFAIAVARTGVEIGRLVAALSRPVMGAIAMIAVLGALRLWVVLPSWGLLLGGAAVGLGAYLPFVWPLRHIVLMEPDKAGRPG